MIDWVAKSFSIVLKNYEQLAEVVKSYPCLYNKQEKDFKKVMVYYRKRKRNHKTCMSTTFAIVGNDFDEWLLCDFDGKELATKSCLSPVKISQRYKKFSYRPVETKL